MQSEVKVHVVYFVKVYSRCLFLFTSLLIKCFQTSQKYIELYLGLHMYKLVAELVLMKTAEPILMCYNILCISWNLFYYRF